MFYKNGYGLPGFGQLRRVEKMTAGCINWPRFVANIYMFELLKDFVQFLKERKKWWLIPMIIVLALFSLILIIGSSSALAPYIYSLF
jgi:hypothetical protein